MFNWMITHCKRYGVIIGFLMMISPSLLIAKNLGTYGQTFPIVEPDFLSFIHQRLNALQASGKLQQLTVQGKANARQLIANPLPIAGIQTATKPEQYTVTPQFKLPHDITTPDGTVLYHQGKTVYPLAHVTLGEALLFIDARDAAQVAWAKQTIAHLKRYKIILTAGNIMSTMKQLGRVYYDQQGVITKRLAIHAVPALAQQVGKSLRITVVSLSQHTPEQHHG